MGHCPWDTVVGLTGQAFTPAAERLVSLSGILCDSFAESAGRILPELAGLRISESTVQRTTQAVGERLGILLGQGRRFGFADGWQWHLDAQGKSCAYISLDLTGVRQQAKEGGKAEGRMPYVAMVFNPVPDLPEDSPHQPDPKAQMQARILSGLYELDALGLQLRKQAASVGMSRADRWIGLTDGGNGLEEFVRRNFPRRPILILDFWHATDHLRELVKVVHPNDEDARQALLQQWCSVLKGEGGSAMIERLNSLSGSASKVVGEKCAEVRNYFEKNRHRMAYPKYISKGWSIGSGAIESACKTVVGQRLKLAGMRWREYGTDTMCHLRALYKSEPGQWQAFWQRSIN